MSLPFTRRNLDLVDKHNIKDVWEHNGVIYSSREATMMAEQKTEKKHTPSSLAAAVLGLNNTAEPSRSTSKLDTMWTDVDTQEMYLRAKPTCYIILGKPGLGAYSLGEAISKKYNCIHLCPMNIMSDEISQESLSGKCLNFNLKHNVPCTHATILKMLIQKLKSPAVKHRGYVISGIPIVNAIKTQNILINPKYTEEALVIIDEILFDIIYNLKRKKPKSQRIPSATESSQSSFKNTEEAELEEEQIVEEQEEIHEGEEEAIVAELPKFVLNSCVDIFRRRKIHFFDTQQVILLKQLEEVFKLSLKPDIVLYITCPDSDVLTKKTHKFINYKNNQYVMEPFSTINTSDIRWPTRYTSSDYEKPHNIHVFNSKYSCRAPINFKKKSIVQVCNYRHYILPFIEKKIMNYDPNQVIKLDGRTSIHQMMHQITERLLLMHINPVIIPEPLYLQEPSDDLEEFWNTVRESHVINNGVLNFTCFPSPWYNRCPVELKKRQSVIGKPALAVKLFKHVYLMSSLKNFVSFCRNPRPFLKLKYLEPTCRIIVTGTRWSGKTMVAECLSWIFDTPVISYASFLETEKQKKYDVFAVRILSEISGTIEDARFVQWKIQENNRINGLDEWTKLVLSELKKYIPLLIQHLEIQARVQEEIDRKKLEQNTEQIDTKEQEENTEVTDAKEQDADAEPMEEIAQEKEKSPEKKTSKKSPTKSQKKTGEKTKTGETKIKTPAEIIDPNVMDPDSLKKFNSIRERLSFLPTLDSITECKAVLANPSILLTYAPLELRTVIEKPKPPALGDVDVTKAISEYIVLNDLQKDIDPTTEELMEELLQLISPMVIKSTEFSVTESYRKFIIDGFPPDPEYWEHLSIAKMIPDYTISIMEDREIVPELVQHYINIKKSSKNYQEILSSVKDPLIISKLQTKPLPIQQVTQNNMKIILHDLINNSLDSLDQQDTTQEGENTDFIKNIEESIEKFRENWDNIKIRLEDISKCYIEIELRDKTDVEVLEEVLLKLRESYFIIGEVNEGEEIDTDENEGTKDLLTYNDSQNFCETNIYCPFTYFKYGLLWEGKREFSLIYNNKVHYFGKEEYVELFQQDIKKHQAYNYPFKKIPKLKICVTGCIGSGKTALSKQLALELGLLHVDFQDVINNYYMPQHYKKVGRMYENPFTDEPEEEEGVVEFHFDEENPNAYDDIVSNEVELRRMLINYFERAQPVTPVYMQKIITKIWNDYPYKETGFVLDGYPRIPQDGEDMIQCNCIPDLVIALDCDLDTSLKRVTPVMFDRWKSQLTQAKIAHRITVDNERQEWMRFVTKLVVVEAILEDILENLIVDNPTSLGRGTSGQSVIMDADPLGSVNVNPNVFNAYNKIIEKYPEPKDTREWEKPLEQLENINSRIEAIQESDNEGMDTLKELLQENKIKVISINSAKPFYKVYRLVLSNLTELRNRSSSYLEQTFIIPTDIAELLISQGYYFLSKFGRMCPVYIYMNPQTIRNNYKISRRQHKLFPIIHRAYIYFIGSEDNVVKFRTNPLKYITSDCIKTHYPYPLTIGITGAPKSGKSVLAAKLAKQNNLLCISRGMALRYILNSMRWSELASRILKKAESGEVIDGDNIMSAVQAVTIDHRTVTYGFVFDGFPNTPSEAMALARDGLYPNIIFEITSDKSVIIKNSQNEIYYDIMKYKPPYSKTFMENRFTRWNEQCYKIRKWINEDYQNICFLHGNESKWKCLQNANNYIQQSEAKIYYYLANHNTKIVPASSMLVPNAVFEQNQSSFRNMCPACVRKNIFRNSSYHGDKTGVVQYKNKFYWICADHLKLVLEYPDYFLLKEIYIPEIPAVVKIINADNVYENGICIVTYAKNLPRQILEPGTNKYAATYKSKTYMFCSESCLHKFLDRPHVFSDIQIFKGSSFFPRLSLKKLPDLGYLEQTLANILTEACCSVNAIRPKYPGLSFQLSGIIYIALYLKTHNPRLPKDQLDVFVKALKVFEIRSNLILDLGLRMRSMENPFASYPKCDHHMRQSNSVALLTPSSSST